MKIKLIIFFIKQNIFFVVCIPVGVVSGFLTGGITEACIIFIVFSVFCILANIFGYKNNMIEFLKVN